MHLENIKVTYMALPGNQTHDPGTATVAPCFTV